MRSSRHWVAVFPSRSWRSCRARSSQANGFDKVIRHARWLPVRSETNRVLSRFEFLHGTASGGIASQSSGRLFQRGPIRLPSGQPAQQFAGLASRELFDFPNSEFNGAHGQQVSQEIGLEQAGFVFIGRAAEVETPNRGFNPKCERAFAGLASPLLVEDGSAPRA